jgi:hypothetical protein
VQEEIHHNSLNKHRENAEFGCKRFLNTVFPNHTYSRGSYSVEDD